MLCLTLGVHSKLDCPLRLRHGNQGQFSVIEIEGGDIATFNLDHRELSLISVSQPKGAVQFGVHP